MKIIGIADDLLYSKYEDYIRHKYIHKVKVYNFILEEFQESRVYEDKTGDLI